MKYKVGDKVRVRSDLNVNLDCSPSVVEEMLCKAGDIVTISAVNDNNYRIDGFRYYWTDEMFEGLVEGELTAEEAIKVLENMCARGCRDCELGKLVKESRYSFCSAYRREHPDKVIEIIKRWKKDHEKKEVEVEFVNIVRVIEDLGYTKKCVYEEDVAEVKDETFKMSMKRVLKEYCKEHEGKFFTVYEEICRVKE